MPSPYIISIVNGTATTPVMDGSYDVTAAVTGYENATISPATVNVTAGVNDYPFTIAATGDLTLHVTQTGAAGGPVVAGATFRRCDSAGVEHGPIITSDAAGDAIFPNMPFAAANAPNIYYKQTGSAVGHTYDTAMQTITMTAAAETLQITNALATPRTTTLTDANYTGLPIEAATITLT